MILECSNCGQRFDGSGLEPGSPVACSCGDILFLPDLYVVEGTVLIESYVKRLAKDEGLTPEQVTTQDGWEFQVGDSRVHMVYDADGDMLTIESAIFPLPEDESRRGALFEKVLQLNYRSTGEARFAIHEDQVVVTFTRAAMGLDYTEFCSAVESVSRAVEDYEEQLRSEFATPPGDLPGVTEVEGEAGG